MTIDLAARTQALEDALAAAGDRLPAELADASRAVVARARERGGLSAEHTVVALAGATGSGKSSVFNALAGRELATAGVRRPTTSHALAAVWGPGADAVLDWLEVNRRHEMSDAGDLVLPNTGLGAMREAMAPLVGPLMARHHMVWLGGDHSITLPLLRAYRAQAGRPLAVLHFDAHCDTWQDHFGEPSGHGTWVYEAMQEELVLDACFTQVGIRSAAQRAARDYVRERGGVIHTARELRGRDGPQQLAPLLDALRARLAAHGSPPLYVSLDIDCLDPAFAPGTGTPEPGGLTTGQVLTLLEGLQGLDCIGMDCVEVAPPYDHADLTSYAAATCVWTYLCGRIATMRR